MAKKAKKAREQDYSKALGGFEVDGTSYALSYTIGRVSMIEDAMGGKPIDQLLSEFNGNISLATLTTIVGYGMCEEGGDFVNPAQGVEMATKLVEVNGKYPVYEAVAMAMGRDCGFLFRGLDAILNRQRR